MALRTKPRADLGLSPGGPGTRGMNLTFAILVWPETPFAKRGHLRWRRDIFVDTKSGDGIGKENHAFENLTKITNE